MGWCGYVAERLTLLLIQGSQSEASGEGALQSGTVAGVPVSRQIGTAARPPHPQEWQGEAQPLVAVYGEPYAKAHLQRIASAVAHPPQLAFGQHEVIDSHTQRSAADRA